MSAASDYLENKLLDHTLGNTAFTQPTVRIALFTNASTNTTANLEAGTLTDEVSGNGYARQSISFGTSTNGTAFNDATVTFPTATGNQGRQRSILRHCDHCQADT